MQTNQLEKVKLDRYRGSFIALAIGDALGAPIQFKARDTYLHLVGYTQGGEFNSQKGEYTDDTAMALCLAQSLIDSNGFDAHNQLQNYIKWLKYGYMSTRDEAFDIGFTVYQSVLNYMDTNETTTPLKQEEYSGNGSLMRLAPVVLYYADDIQKAVYYAGKSSLTTHSSPIAIDGCRYFAYILTQLLHGAHKFELFTPQEMKKMNQFFKKEPLHSEISKIANGSFLTKTREQISSSGYIVHTLEASLWAFYNGTSFKNSLLKAVNLGDDADTVGAVTGQLCGAFYGFSQIDKKFLDKLYNKSLILELADKLYELRKEKDAN